jgi:thioredoxin-related protein
MKNRISLLLLLLFPALAVNAEVQFIKGGWDEALAQAKNENKFIFVDCMTDWCHWCKEMDHKTFMQSDVSGVMNAKFVCVKMDMEKDMGVKLCMKYRVSGFPTFLVFNTEGKLVNKTTGYLESAGLIDFLEASADPSQHPGYEGVSNKVELSFPEFYVKSFKGNSSGKVLKPSAGEVNAYLATQENLFSEINWSVLSRYLALAPSYHQRILNNKAKLIDLYGKDETNAAIESIINVSFKTAVKNKDESQLKETLAMVDKHLEGDQGKLKSSYYISFYQQTDQWLKMDKMVMERINAYGIGEELNEYGWAVYENCDNETVINDAAEWMKKLCEKNPSYPSLDTYAALLYKNKQYAEAEKTAMKAIETGKQNNEDVAETETLLEKIKAGVR